MYSLIKLKLSKLPDGRRTNWKKNCHYFMFFRMAWRSSFKTGWCVNIRSKEEFQGKNLWNSRILFKRRNKLWRLSHGIQEPKPQTLPKFIKQNNNFRFPCNHVTSLFSEITKLFVQFGYAVTRSVQWRNFNMRWSFFSLVNRRILNSRNRYENTYKISLDLIRFGTMCT